MKKILTLFLLAFLLVVVTSCKQQPQDSGLNEVMIQDGNVRKALSLAINKGYYTDVLLANGSFPANYYVPFDFYSYNGVDFRTRAKEVYPDLASLGYTMPDGTDVPTGYNHYNVAEAKRLWEEAKEKFNVGNRTVTFNLLVHSNASWTSLYEHIKSEIEKNLPGAKIRLDVVTFGEKLKKQQTGDYDIIFSGWGPDYQDPVTFLDLYLSESGHNTGKYSNERYDELVLGAKTGALTGQERFDALIEAEKILINDDVVVMPIFQSKAVGLANPDIRNLWGQKVGPDFFFKWVKSDKVNNGTPNKTLVLLEQSNIPDLKSWTTTDQVSFYILGSVNEGLTVAHDPKGETPYVNGMAESWDITENTDGTVTYTFNLRPNQPWVTNTGAPYTVNGVTQYVKAQDFVFAWKKLGDPREASQYSYMLETAGIKGAAELIYADPEDIPAIETALANLGVRAINDTTLEVTLLNDAAYFLGLMSFPSFYPVNEQFFTSLGVNAQGVSKYATSQDPSTVLYNGAFYFSTWSNDDKHVLTKNNNYWDKDNVDLEQVIWLVKPGINPETEVQMYIQGQIDRCVLRNAATQEQYSGRPDARIGGSTTAWYLEFNVNNH